MSKVKYATSDLEEWNDRTASIPVAEVGDIAYGQIFERFLPHNTGLKCLEIGAIPGTFLVYFHNRFGYKITGLDFAANSQIFKDTMAANNIDKFEYIDADFLTYKSPKQYDVVTSFGFVEHFDDYEGVVKRHCDLVKPGGYVIITMPNFRNLQYVYHRLFDKPNLDIHNLNAMRPKALDRVLVNEGFHKLFNGYFGSLELWRNDSPLGPGRRYWELQVRRWAARLKDHLPVSRLYTPSLILIYQKASDAK